MENQFFDPTLCQSTLIINFVFQAERFGENVGTSTLTSNDDPVYNYDFSL
jgi:hypothetical protein